MASPSSPGSRRGRGRVAVIVDAVAEAEERLACDEVSSQGDVRAALVELGFEPVVVEFTGDLAAWLAALRDGEFVAAFNLCESLGGEAVGESLAADAVEQLGLPLTGPRAFTLALCLRKDVVNGHLRALGLPVPEWALATAGEPLEWRRYPAIVKPAAEDASLGIDARSVVRNRRDLEAARDRGHPRFGRLIVQRYVDGREFNLAIVGDRVLPHSEIVWSLPKGVPRIVSYAGKWEPNSADYRGTPPQLLGPKEARLGARLTRLARRVWAAVDGTGYGRVDVRMDARGRLHVIDVNPNPDLSPDAGLARQAKAAGWSYSDLVGRIVDLALQAKGAAARPRAGRGRGRAVPA